MIKVTFIGPNHLKVESFVQAVPSKGDEVMMSTGNYIVESIHHAVTENTKNSSYVNHSSEIFVNVKEFTSNSCGCNANKCCNRSCSC